MTIQIDREGSREDAPPLCEAIGRTTVLGVFDGLGGAGAVGYQTPNGTFSGAYLASRRVRSSVREWSYEVLRSGEIPPDAGSRLEQRIRKDLNEYSRSLRPSGSRLRSSMLRTLPTTLTVLAVSEVGRPEPEVGNSADGLPSKVVCRYFWAGDSRGYLLSPDAGLQQLTRDHLKGSPDAYENLSADSPLSNCVCADRPFRLSEASVNGRTAAVFLAATDGCFGYLQSPVLFEGLLLDTLADSDSVGEWQDRLTAEVDRTTGDDATLSAVGVGFSGFQQMKESFAVRRERVEDRVGPLRVRQARRDELRSEAEAAEKEYSEALRTSWDEYRKSYEAILPSEGLGGTS
ncbi:hypothetical protein [Actinorugispora endophytica]|uniref:hypothetical protein n=1 Tax=Actinorugispora endophytica TaxID=1605990 RepID=UPI001415256A|nr:hypothetical protein [Actinorugispora endophytica]